MTGMTPDAREIAASILIALIERSGIHAHSTTTPKAQGIEKAETVAEMYRIIYQAVVST
ncbi:MAG: hypothetical protein Q8P50_05370 [Bacillota bacterium]|jgi:hypothetical protein|nr:hypothetical protein [Bacillota bacterium]